MGQRFFNQDAPIVWSQTHRGRSQIVQHKWLIRVLEELQTYARLHALPKLADQLDQARLLAMLEIAGLPDRDVEDPHL